MQRLASLSLFLCPFLTAAICAQTCDLVLDANPGSASSFGHPRNAPDGDSLYFSTGDPTSTQIWKLGPGGAKPVNNSTVGRGYLIIHSFWNGRKHINLVRSKDSTYGEELRTLDDSAGIRLLYDINPGSASSQPQHFITCGNQVFFNAGGPRGGLWRTDGTVAGTRRLSPQNSNFMTGLNGSVYFTLYSAARGSELWVSDGTIAGTQILIDIYPGASGSKPYCLTRVGDRIAFTATTPRYGYELYVTDGTAAGTALVRDILPGSAHLSINHMYAVNGALIIAAHNPFTRGVQFWRSDLTAAGTSLISSDIYWSIRGLNASVSGNQLFFARPKPGGNSHDLYVMDGTPAGTRLVTGIPPGTVIGEMIAAGTGVYFAARTTATGNEIFYSDGSAAGAKLVCDLNPGPSSSDPAGFTAVRGEIYFSAETSAYGRELHVLRPSRALVQRLGEGCGPTPPELDASPPVLGGNVELRGLGAPASGPRLLVLGVASSPYAVQGLGLPGCAIWVNLTVSLTLPVSQGSNWTRTISIPNDPALAGVSATMQAAYAPGPALSNAVQLTIGR